MLREKIIKGVPASSGISIGKSYLYIRRQVNVNLSLLKDGDIEKEITDLHKSIEVSLKELEKIYSISVERIGEKNSKIFEAQLEILRDNIFLDNIIKRIKKEKKSAGYIFNDEIEMLKAVFMNSANDYMKERYTDLIDVKNRVIRNMKREKLVSKVEEDSIIFAHELTPADTILFSRRKVQGYVTDTGGITSHAAIIARALRVPAVVGLKNITKQIESGVTVIVDGYTGTIIINPTQDTIKSYDEKIKENNLHKLLLNSIVDKPCQTVDKKKISITANIEFLEEVDFLKNCGNCGIGLYRTEHLYMEKGEFPSVAEQIEDYSYISNVIYPNIVTIRTFDLGGDKIIQENRKEDNPYLGWRGIRVFLDRVSLFKEQLRALLIASVKKNVRIMLPMISSVDEIRKTKIILSQVKSELEQKGINYDKNIKLGIMIEVPSAIFLAEEFAKECDFFSIGTNDLIQYTLAVDRNNEFISSMYQQFHPAIIRALKKICDSAHKSNIKISLCGEMASVPIAIPVLIGLGIDELSVLPSVFPDIKQVVRNLNYEETVNLVNKLLKFSTETEIKQEVEKFYNEKLKPVII